MPRPSKIEVSAINLRIPADKPRDYTDLIAKIFEKRVAVKVYGDSFVAITQYNKDSRLGVISKYSEIDIDGDWFDLEDFGPADPEKVDEGSIPETLRPNLSAFYFELDEESHVGSVAQIDSTPRFPVPQTDLSHSFRDGYAERGVAVQDGDADLDLGDLSVEVPRHEPLAQQFDTMYLRFDAASAVVSAPSSPQGTAEVF